LKPILYNFTAPLTDTLKEVGNFFQKGHIVIQPRPLSPPEGHLVFYLLFILLSLIALIRFFYPRTLQAVFTLFFKGGTRRDNDHYSKPGWAVPLFLSINFWISVTLLASILLIRYHYLPANTFSNPTDAGKVAGFVFLFFFINQLFTLLSGILFNVKITAGNQLRNNQLWMFISGIVLTPLLLVYFYSGSRFLIDGMIITMVILLLFKWFQTFRNGLSEGDFQIHHIFLYLCAVEIAPLLWLIKLGTG
jgi:magnesium-transporting ATPase (P-type)